MPGRLTPEYAAAIVVDLCGMPLADILHQHCGAQTGNTVRRRALVARNHLVWMLHEYSDMSYPEIARALVELARQHCPSTTATTGHSTLVKTQQGFRARIDEAGREVPMVVVGPPRRWAWDGRTIVSTAGADQ